MNTEDDDQGDACATCPGCRMRRGLTKAIQADPLLRQRLLDELLDTVERLRGVDSADDDEEIEAAADTADQMVDLLQVIHEASGIDQGDD